MLVELRQAFSDQILYCLSLEDPPQPGNWLRVGEDSFLVLQRCHRYTLCSGQYILASVTLMVQYQQRPVDAVPWLHGWVIGNPNCQFNALSPLIRCAVLPDGPCDSCVHFVLR
ncbi:hypothetical protein OMCYN_01431 [cyanobiont of Ornithocercus magnificus]|nr:hypothetical protein OMCYN_01431 [cyanobiont of Ornithocercus magnificus]